MKQYFVILFTFAIPIIGTTQTVLGTLNDIYNEKSIDKLDQFFQEWSDYSIESREKETNDTIIELENIYRTLLKGFDLYKITFNPDFQETKPNYFIPQNRISYGIKKGKINLNKLKVTSKTTNKTVTLKRIYKKGHSFIFGKPPFFIFKNDLNYERTISFYPEITRNEMKICYLKDKYLDFEKFIAYQNRSLQYRLIPKPTPESIKQIEFVKELVMTQNGLLLGQDGPGVQFITLNRSLDKAIVFHYSDCDLGGIPIIMEKDVYENWNIIEFKTIMERIRINTRKNKLH